MFDKLIDRHKSPINLLLHAIAFVLLIYGLWNHNWTWIIVGIIMCIIGHLFPYKQKTPIV